MAGMELQIREDRTETYQGWHKTYPSPLLILKSCTLDTLTWHIAGVLSIGFPQRCLVYKLTIVTWIDMESFEK